ncbi:MAG: FixH family protein [Nannocystaceae bacterium]
MGSKLGETEREAERGTRLAERLTLLLSVALSVAACDGSDSDAGTQGQDECGPSAYVPGLVAHGPNGYRVTLLDSMPGPPEKGENRWAVALADATGLPVSDAELIVAPRMPEHGHGTAVQALLSPGDTAGEYVADPVHFSMAGVWEITVGVSGAQGAPTDEAVFTLCIES